MFNFTKHCIFQSMQQKSVCIRAYWMFNEHTLAVPLLCGHRPFPGYVARDCNQRYEHTNINTHRPFGTDSWMHSFWCELHGCWLSNSECDWPEHIKNVIITTVSILLHFVICWTNDVCCGVCVCVCMWFAGLVWKLGQPYYHFHE